MMETGSRDWTPAFLRAALIHVGIDAAIQWHEPRSGAQSADLSCFSVTRVGPEMSQAARFP
jgi:hypothetical protein